MMSDPTTNPRPRPRPRPRPIVNHAESTASNPESSASRSSGSAIPLSVSGKPLVIEVHDNDEMFMRNKNRTIQTWQKLDKLNNDNSKSKKDLSDSDDGSSPRKHKRQKQKPRASPRWQKAKLDRLMAADLTDDSDSDIEILGGNSTPKGKRKRRERSRSRSITPPPALPEHQLQNAKNVVHQALRVAARAPSPTNFDPDESTDTIIFQSELNAIAQEVAKQSHRASSQAPADSEQDHIVLNVTWHPHPLETTAQRKEWQYRIDRHDNFRDLFDAVAEDAHILSVNLILTYQGKRFFPSVTPAILKIWTDSAEMAAYDKRSYEYIQKNSFISPHTDVASTSTIPGQTEGIIEVESEEEEIEQGPYVPQSQTQESEAESEAEGETFRLILRSSGNKDITLTVRPTTKCGAIVKAFINKLGLAEQYPHIFADAPAKTTKKRGRKSRVNTVAATTEKDPRLCIDGDKMDNESAIGDMDLEDGDMVEVIGL